MLWQVVGEPFLHLAQRFGLGRADLLFEFAQGRFDRSFAVVDPTLRHLPALDRLVDTPSDEHQSVAIDQHHADARAIGEIFVTQKSAGPGHVSNYWALGCETTPVAGTRTKPRPRRPCAQAATRCRGTG